MLRRTSDSGSIRCSETGQAMLMDFALASFLFVLAWAFISSEYSENYASSEKSALIGLMRLKADSIMEGLVKSPGSPENWHELSIADVNTIGLAVSDRVLSEEKLAAFSNFSSDYGNLKSRLGLGEFDFYFSFDGIDDSAAGLQPQSTATEIVVQRIVTYKGDTGIAALNVYRLEQ